MSKSEMLNGFPAHRLEGALRFSAHEVRARTQVPDFALYDLSGKTVRLSSYRNNSNVVLMFGSVTCGATATQLRAGKPSIRSLYSRYKKKRFEFFLIYTKEPHPGENIPQPTTVEERVKNAVLHDLHTWEKAQARNELVRVCYSERLVGLLRNKKISASVHRRAGPQAAQDFVQLLDAEGKIG